MKIIRKSINKIMASRYSAYELFKNLSSDPVSQDDDYYVEDEYFEDAYGAIYDAVHEAWPSAKFNIQHNGQGWVWSDDLWFEFPDGKTFWFKYTDEEAEKDKYLGPRQTAEHIWEKFMSKRDLVERMNK